MAAVCFRLAAVPIHSGPRFFLLRELQIYAASGNVVEFYTVSTEHEVYLPC
jgi:hypothetical protein